MIYRLHYQQQLNCTLQEAWEFFSSPRNLDRITPKDIGFKITHCSSEDMHEGQLITYKIKIAPFTWVRWLTEITVVKPPYYFIDDQRAGPYKLWHHTHRFEEKDGGVFMIDEVTYIMPFSFIGRIAHALFVKSQLKHIFRERARACHEIFNA